MNKILSIETLKSAPGWTGLWLIFAIVLTNIISDATRSIFGIQAMRQQVLFGSLILLFFFSAYQWAISLINRSGGEADRLSGVLAGIFIPASIFSGLIFYEPLFVSIMTLLGIEATDGGSHAEFYVVFVTWIGLVGAAAGLALGFGMKQTKLSLKLLLSGFLANSLSFATVALLMELFGYRVGTVRPDGIPSMPIVTITGFIVTALVGSTALGKLISQHIERSVE